MDVLRPQLMWIEGKCYRKNFMQQKIYNQEEKDDDKLEIRDIIDCNEDYEANIVELPDGKFQATVSIPSAFYSYIVGAKGNTKKRVESETRTRIYVPTLRQPGDVVITGTDKQGVSSALRRMQLLVSNMRYKTAPTHFLCIPFNIKSFQNSFLDFKEDVLRNFSKLQGLDASLFQKPEKLHLTIGTLVLMDEVERKAAAKILEQCNEEIIKPLLKSKPLEVVIEDIEYMNDDPGAVDVLYAKVRLSDGSDRLQIIAQKLQDKFVESGYMNQQYDHVKLHITLMNTLFRTDDSSVNAIADRRNRRNRETFNAVPVLKIFGNYKFSVVRISTIHISVLHSVGDDGFYTCSSSIQLT